MAATIKQVAQMAGVSTATVSKYLNGIQLKEKNRKAVENAIQVLDYRCNEFARNLRKNKSMTVGVLIPELDNIFSTQIVSNIENMLMDFGYSTIICDYKTDADLEKQKLEFLKHKMADAIVIMPYKLQFADIDECNVPVVFIDRVIDGVDCDSVLVDNKNASYEAVEYFIQNGHTKIGIFLGPKDIFTAKERLLGYLEALKKHGIAIREDFILRGNYDVKSGYELAQRIMRQEDKPTAILATNYEITTGAVMALNEMNLMIPQDISFIGFDNRELADAVRPRLSVVLQPIEEIGKNVAEILIEKLLGNEKERKSVILKTKLLMQNSVKSL